ncbi:putative polysaccharide biosynthesis protein [Zongyangia hominis]|uniref:Polysaccharide biosynthesis protein n=1 Tax=Zongyangia hominis TaxID=2763677 RepID=A0A926IB51_9FIRM|nr:polysaccharide biosynthesis protein [Zongyangia hominis]MBC8569807.1 polysaccharide biosynthesis protein [Zongyangia hominis]
MPNRPKQSFLHGAIILMAATIIVKLIGAVFKIPLTNLIGGEGMGYFTTAYGLFNPIYALSIAGLPVAVAKMVAENAAIRRYKDIRRIMRISTALFLGTGLVGLTLMIFGSGLFVRAVGNPGAFWSVVAISPAIFFGCMTSAYRGYYQGLRNMYPTAASQIVEAVCKLTAGMLGAYLMMQWGLNQFKGGGKVFGQAAATLAEAQSVTLPYAAAGAIFGVTLSTFAGMFYLWLRHKRKGDGITPEELEAAPEPRPANQLRRRLIKLAIPVCLGAVVVNLTSMIDLASVMNRLDTAIARDSGALLAMYGHLIPAGMTLDQLPNFLFGSYQALSITIFNLVPALTTTFGVSALPAVATAWATRSMKDLQRNVEVVLRITCLVAIPAGLGLFALGGPILHLLFSARAAEAIIATPLLRTLGIAAIFVAVATPVNSMLQAVGRPDLPVKLMVVGGIVKLGINFFLVAIPSINIHGAPIGTVLCYLIIVLVGIVCLCRTTGVVPRVGSVFLKPLIAGGICATAGWASYGLFRMGLSGSMSTIASIAVAGVVYVLALFLIHAITKDDILMLPKGEKIAKLLEKRGLIG